MSAPPVAPASATDRRSVGRWFDDLLFGPEAPARLLAVQALFLVLIAVRTVLSPYPKLAGAPEALFKPAWAVSWLDAMPPRWVIVLVQVAIVGAAVAWFVIGRHPQWRGPVRRGAYAIAWLGFFFLAALRGSRGKIFHIELLLVWASLPLVFAPGDARWSDRRPQRRYGWTIRTAIAAMSVIYCFTGLQKLRASGLGWVFSDNMKWALAWGRVRGEATPLQDVAVWLAAHRPLPEIFALCILVFEVSFPLVVFFRRVRPAFVVAAWLFHMGTVLLLGLDYTMWPATVTILLLDWPAIVDRVSGWRGRTVQATGASPPVHPAT
ncbi:MAG: hypothetical protein FJW95_14335 [Actinobacteria bacterium]|nr:hypothetical protein [Actinomycetota bacterium]